MNIKDVEMDFDYVKQFNTKPPDAYATLLLDAMRGDQTLYKHRDEIEQAWRIVQPVLDHWQEHNEKPVPQYASGSWGPAEGDALLKRNRDHWHNH